MARRHLWRNDIVRSYWRTRHPLLRFLCLHEAVTLPFVVAISDPTYLFAIIHLHFGDCLSGTLFSSRWSAMEFRRCQPPCARFIAREDPHSKCIKCIKCLGFSHARDAVYGTSKCKICDDFRLITLRSRLEDCERESSIFPRRASNTSAAPREISWPLVELRAGVRMSSSRRWRVSRQASPFLSLPLPSARVRIRRSNFCMILFPSGTWFCLTRARWCSAHGSLRLRGFLACFSRCAPA